MTVRNGITLNLGGSFRGCRSVSSFVKNICRTLKHESYHSYQSQCGRSYKEKTNLDDTRQPQEFRGNRIRECFDLR